MNPLIELNDPQAIQSGLFPDLAPQQTALWRDGENLTFTDGSVEKCTGWDVIETGRAYSISALAQSYSDGFRRVYQGAGTEVWMSTDLAPSIRLGSGFNAAGRWSLETYGNFAFATNNVETPQIYANGGANTMASWGNLGALGTPFLKARIVRKIYNFPMLFSGQRVVWPAYNDIYDFIPGPGKRAGDFFIRDLDSEVMAVEPIGTGLLFYSGDMWGYIAFVGGEAAMDIQVRGTGIGAVGPSAVVPVGNFHYGVSRKGIWKTDGNVFDYVDRGIVNRWLNAHIDWTRKLEVVAQHNERLGQVEFYFPCLDNVVRGLGFKYAGQTSWTKLKKPVTAASPQQELLHPVVALGTSWALDDKGTEAGAAALASSLTTAAFNAGQANRFKRWDMVRVPRTGTGVVEVRFGYADTEDAAPDWTAWEELTRDNWLSGRESVYLTMDLRSTAANVSWRLGGVSAFGVLTGVAS